MAAPHRVRLLTAVAAAINVPSHCQEPRVGCWVVLDGHGGARASTWLQNNLAEPLIEVRAFTGLVSSDPCLVSLYHCTLSVSITLSLCQPRCGTIYHLVLPVVLMILCECCTWPAMAGLTAGATAGLTSAASCAGHFRARLLLWRCGSG